MAGWFGDLRRFLKEFNVLTVAVGFVVGTAVRDYVRAVVDDLVMPLVNVVMPDVGWEKWVLRAGEAKVAGGALLASTIDFALIFLVIYFIAKGAKTATKAAAR